jgi:hypothetical protein
MAGKKRDGNTTQSKAGNSSEAGYNLIRESALRWLYRFLLGKNGHVDHPVQGDDYDLLGTTDDIGDSGVSESDIISALWECAI